MKHGICACECSREGDIFARGLLHRCYYVHHYQGTLTQFPADRDCPDPLSNRCKNEVSGYPCIQPRHYDREARVTRSFCKECWDRTMFEHA